jgi:hypothetical protein
MFKFIKKLFEKKSIDTSNQSVLEAPYKIEAPEVPQLPVNDAVQVDDKVQTSIITTQEVENKVDLVKNIPEQSATKPQPKKRTYTKKSSTSQSNKASRGKKSKSKSN